MTNNENIQNPDNINTKLLETIKKELEKDELKKIIDSLDFYFSEEDLTAFDLIKDLKKEDLENLQNEFGNTTKVKEFVAEKKKNNNNKTLIETLDKINKFVSYCDLHALGTDSNGKEFQEDGKKYIANAFVRQHIWVKSIITYLLNNKEGKNQNEEQRFKNVTYSVQNAIKYFEKPEKRFPILSKDHREKISLHYLKGKLEDDQFDENLKKYFDNKITNIQCDKNRTHVYTRIIYSQRKEWSNEIDTSFLENNRNIILTGAPGTGKTYLAQKMAKKLTNTKSDDKENPQIKMVQFHPSYDYTDFVEGLRPVKGTGNKGVDFELKDGVFKQFCIKALNNPDKPFVFVIDEINRGEMSKIFGELFFSIDPDYRGKQGAVQTQYANMVKWGNQFDRNLDNGKKGQFFVPKKVYIIGTMNDIDRSVESMDFAFRRRFAFMEVAAEDSMGMLGQLGTKANDARKAMIALNEALVSPEKGGLTYSYQIGGSYFLKLKPQKDNDVFISFEELWDFYLKGTLYEYFRGEPDAEKKMTILKKAYDDALKSKTNTGKKGQDTPPKEESVTQNETTPTD